jgi:hypothetical protein
MHPYFKVDSNENRGGSRRLQMLGSGLRLRRSRFILILNEFSSCKNLISFSACRSKINPKISITIGDVRRIIWSLPQKQTTDLWSWTKEL